MRAVLGLLVIFAWRRFRKQLEVNFGQSVTIWFTLITASQFHFMYYLSRPLPNTFALVSGKVVISPLLLSYKQYFLLRKVILADSIIYQDASYNDLSLFPRHVSCSSPCLFLLARAEACAPDMGVWCCRPDIPL